MNPFFIGLIIYGNFVVALLLYIFIFQRRKVMDLQLGINISIVAGGMIALTTGVLLIFQYPFHYTLITIIATLLGIGVGGVFGALFDYQTFLTGLVNGLMLGLMAPMIGAIITDQILFIIVIEGFFLLVITMIIIAIKKS